MLADSASYAKPKGESPVSPVLSLPLSVQAREEAEVPHHPAARADFRPIHYLGSKLKVLPPILDAIRGIAPPGSSVCDLFSGSGTVALALSPGYRIVSVDIQRYSQVLCEAVLNSARSDADDDFMQRYFSNVALLSDAAFEILQFEKQALMEAVSGNLEPVANILERGNLIAAATAAGGGRDAFSVAVRRAGVRLTQAKASSTCLRYYGGAFFSYRQALQIDAIADTVRERNAHPNYLAALLSTASSVVNTVGNQFAQPLKLRDKAGALKLHLAAKIIRDRGTDVLRTYLEFLRRYSELPPPRYLHETRVGDFRDVLPSLRGKISAVYADPPYTRDHYSRYYHVLETLAVGDEPVLSMSNLGGGGVASRGIYRVNRHQSDFCIKSRAPSALDELCGLVRQMDVPLVLSYSGYNSEVGARPRVLSVSDVREIAARHYPSVDVRVLENSAHNKLNAARLNKGGGGTAEILLVCK